MFLSFVDRSLLAPHLGDQAVAAELVKELLVHRAVVDGTPVVLDETTMLPVEPLCSWFRHLADDKDVKTLREYAYIVRRFVRFLDSRGRDVLAATETDLRAYRLWRTESQQRPVGDAMWAKEAQLINQLYGWLEENRYIAARPLRLGRRGRNPLAPRLRRSMDIRHLTLAQYRYFRDVGLAGQHPDSRAVATFRGWAPLRNGAAADLAVCTGMRPQEWSTVLGPELGLDQRRPGPQAGGFTVQACAKYGRAREVFVPAGAWEAVETYWLLERPQVVAASAQALTRRRRELFVVDEIDPDTAAVSGVLEGRRRSFALSAMPPSLRRITVRETEGGLESLAVFVGHGGQMLGSSAWYRIRCEAWERMQAQAGDRHSPVLPRRRWRWHDLRHTFALQLLAYLEQQLHGDAPKAVERRRRHLAYLGGHIRHNPLLQVSRRLGHASPATTYQYLEYADDPSHAVDEAFREWSVHDDDTYAAIAANLLVPAGGGG